MCMIGRLGGPDLLMGAFRVCGVELRPIKDPSTGWEPHVSMISQEPMGVVITEG